MATIKAETHMRWEDNLETQNENIIAVRSDKKHKR